MQGKSEDEIKKFSEIFQEVQKVVDSKQLNPMIRTQYMRTAFQIPFDATVRVSLDTNLAMIKENPDVGPSCAISGRSAQSAPLCVHCFLDRLELLVDEETRVDDASAPQLQHYNNKPGNFH